MLQPTVILAATDPLVVGLGGLVVGAVVGVVIMVLQRRTREGQLKSDAEREAAQTLEQARRDAEATLKDAQLAAKEELLKKREALAEEEAKRTRELGEMEIRLGRLEESLAERERALERRMRETQERDDALAERKTSIDKREAELDTIYEQQKETLTRVAGLSRDEARTMLLERMEQDLEQEHAKLVGRMVDQAKAEGEEKARDVIATAIQRVAADHSAEVTVSTVDLPNDDMKGRVIGREGRNIRAFERASGVDIVVDDTPGVIVVSAFDGVRRETARRAMVRLLKDGRIHPAKIEEVVKVSRNEMEEVVQEAGRKAVQEADIGRVHPKLISLLGRLKYRTSYGQNVLLHSQECGWIAGALAGELGLDVGLATRCGLLHDIGKAVDHEVEGGHATIGGDIARRCQEDPVVVNAIAAHHDDVPMESVYAVLTAAADAISAARPGARRDSLERYVKRLQALEEIAHRYGGVRQAYAIQAGREVRVMVDPGKVTDRMAKKIAYDLARNIENELTYPGEVKVTCIRETRVTETAR